MAGAGALAPGSPVRSMTVLNAGVLEGSHGRTIASTVAVRTHATVLTFLGWNPRERRRGVILGRAIVAFFTHMHER